MKPLGLLRRIRRRRGAVTEPPFPADRTSGEDALANSEHALAEVTPTGQTRLKVEKL